MADRKRGMGDCFYLADRRRYRHGGLGGTRRATDFLGEERIRQLQAAWLHAGGNVIVILVQLYNWYLRYSGGAEAVMPTGLILSLLVVLILLFTGWKGWEMVYQHHVGISDEPPEHTADQARLST